MLNISRHPNRPGVYRLEAQQTLPYPLAEVFKFFADAFQLEAITPPWLKFHVVTPQPVEMRPGLKIDYRLRVHGISLKWQSLISVWEPPYRFVDEQVRGPYRLWYHEHRFREEAGQTVVDDIVDYAPLGGRFANWLMVERDLRTIFTFRQQRLDEIFHAER